MTEKVDPWQMQAELMHISGQKIPTLPTINNGSLLYAALIAEEAGELFIGLGKAMDYDDGKIVPENLCLFQLSVSFAALGKMMVSESIKMRKRLADMTVSVGMTEAQAIEILDGTVDLTVVNSGFALAAGLPGAEGYLEIARSNLSKANPDTGLIDKDSSGKWLKGRNFHLPDLSKVLALFARNAAMP